ncbi:uncharacterized protein LOC143204892 isoform X2 [Rhynchophorus ferrugineus]|uniref:uncharacterized protein LOC143204892 isoform X2 n=1 Tax=Rhynchophorus ferrugineus TaxID=354439 RepID=UPI003FCC2B91
MMSMFIPTKRHFREILLFLFNSRKSAAGSYRELLEAYGEYTPSIKTCEYWFRRFKKGDFDTADKERPGQPRKYHERNKRAHLLRYQRFHNGNRPFLCPHCVKAFSRHDNLKHHIKKTHQWADKLEQDSLYSIGQVEIVNPNLDLLEEPPPIRREDLIPLSTLNKHLTYNESDSSRILLIKRSTECPSVNHTEPENNDTKSISLKSTDNYNITNMPFGDLEYLTKSDNEQCDTLPNLMQGHIIEPLVEIKIEQRD